MMFGQHPEIKLEGLYISLSFGGIVAIAILLFGNSSGAHINPAVTFYFYLRNKLSLKHSIFYILMQCLGATLASIALLLLFDFDPTLGSTLPNAGIETSWLLEFGMTMALIVLIHFINGKNTKLVAVLIGSLIFLEAFYGESSTGASMNPARSLGPMLISGNMEFFWIYLSSQITAVLVVIGLAKRVKN